MMMRGAKPRTEEDEACVLVDSKMNGDRMQTIKKTMAGGRILDRLEKRTDFKLVFLP